MMQLKDFDELIEALQGPSGDIQTDKLVHLIITSIQLMRSQHQNLINELLTMYTSASEHNVDISRDAILRLIRELT